MSNQGISIQHRTILSQVYNGFRRDSPLLRASLSLSTRFQTPVAQHEGSENAAPFHLLLLSLTFFHTMAAFRILFTLLRDISHLRQYPGVFTVARDGIPASRPYRFPPLEQRRCANGYGGGPQLPGQVAPQPGQPEESEDDSVDNGIGNPPSEWRPTLFKMFESAATTMVSLFVLG